MQPPPEYPPPEPLPPAPPIFRHISRPHVPHSTAKEHHADHQRRIHRRVSVPLPDLGRQGLPADIKEPSLARVANGWAIEQPPHTYFNWHMNRTDNRLVSLEAHLARLEQQVTRLAQENARLKQLAAER